MSDMFRPQGSVGSEFRASSAQSNLVPQAEPPFGRGVSAPSRRAGGPEDAPLTRQQASRQRPVQPDAPALVQPEMAADAAAQPRTEVKPVTKPVAEAAGRTAVKGSGDQDDRPSDWAPGSWNPKAADPVEDEPSSRESTSREDEAQPAPKNEEAAARTAPVSNEEPAGRHARSDDDPEPNSTPRSSHEPDPKHAAPEEPRPASNDEETTEASTPPPPPPKATPPPPAPPQPPRPATPERPAPPPPPNRRATKAPPEWPPENPTTRNMTAGTEKPAPPSGPIAPPPPGKAYPGGELPPLGPPVSMDKPNRAPTPTQMHELDEKVGRAVIAGKQVNPADMDPVDAAVARGATAVANNNLDHPSTPGEPLHGDPTPREVPPMATITQHLRTRGETIAGLINAAKALDGSARAAASRVGGAATTALSLAKRILPAAVADRMPQDEHDLRTEANKIIARAYGSDQTRRQGPSASPLLWARAAYLAGQVLRHNPDATGAKELAAAALEGLDRSLHHAFGGTTQGKGGVPRILTDVQQVFSGVKLDIADQRAPRSRAIPTMANVAVRYVNQVYADRAAVAAARERAGAAESAARDHDLIERPTQETRGNVSYARTLLSPVSAVARQAHEAARAVNTQTPLKLTDISELAERSAAGDPQARDTLNRYERNSAASLRSTVALMEQSQVGDPAERQQASAELAKVWPQARTNLLRYVYAHKEAIAKGDGVTPEMVKLVNYIKPATPTEGKMVDDLLDATTDAAFVHFEGKATFKTTLGDKTVHVRTAAQLSDKNIPEFVREAYADDLSKPPIKGVLPPREFKILADAQEMRDGRMYEYAKVIRDARAIPEILKPKYHQVMRDGKNPGRPATTPRTERAVGAVRRLANRVMPPERGWR